MKHDLEGYQVDSFAIGKHLSDGRYTEVYLAEGSDGRPVIIKALNPHLQKTNAISAEQVRWHFQIESEIAKRVRHKNIVQFVSSGEAENRSGQKFQYIILEYLSGGHLGAFCRQQHALTPGEVRDLFDPVCEALSLVHQHGIIHCDLKPANFLLDDANNPSIIKLADFGVAKIVEPGQPIDRTLVGTAPYAAPEHHPNANLHDLAQPLDERADVFALAMTLLEVMTGIKPSFNKRQVDSLPLHPSFSQHRQHVLEILRRATAIRVEQRYRSVAEFWEDFKMHDAEDNSRKVPRVDPNDEEIETVSVAKPPSRMIIPVGGSAEKAKAPGGQYILLPDNVKIELVPIPAGEIQMGTDSEEFEKLLEDVPDYLKGQAKQWLDWETPRRLVNLQSFWLAKYPVTRRQWRAVASSLKEVARPLELNPQAAYADDEQPVTMVSWDEAFEFCSRLTRHTRRIVRLPSEAEWEYACRGATVKDSRFAAAISAQSINCKNIHKGSGQITHPSGVNGPSIVGTIGKPNQFGLYDMHGNVWEWCSDAWHENYYGAPRNGDGWENVQDALRVARGGSWYSLPFSCRCASRSRFLCNDRFSDIGFRISL